MRAFVLCTGRCGSLTLSRALGHATNYTVGHELLAHAVKGRLKYPDNHIEVDNRLSWFLGPLGERFPDALWIHLRRDSELVAQSYARRFGVRAGIMQAFSSGILRRSPVKAKPSERMALARLYVSTVNANIEGFLKGQPEDRVLRMDLEFVHPSFDRLWERLSAEGNREAAHAELDRIHNRSKRSG